MRLVRLIVAVLVCQLVGVLGSIFTVPSIPTWYASINKPAFIPPNWIFAPVWTTLFALMGIAAFLVWERGIKKPEVKSALMVFGVQLALNLLWSVLFFGLQAPLYALIEIVILWLAILWTIIRFYRISKLAGWLLVPYILWVSFASFLNLSVWWLNR